MINGTVLIIPDILNGYFMIKMEGFLLIYFSRLPVQPILPAFFSLIPP